MKIAFDLDGTLIRSDYDFELATPKHRFLSKMQNFIKSSRGYTHNFSNLCYY
jgi:hypothetical protein